MDQWIGLTIGEVLRQCGADFHDVQLLDEPPGKLRAVEFTCIEGPHSPRVILEMDYHADLFSVDRSWSQTLVEAQKVARVHHSRNMLF